MENKKLSICIPTFNRAEVVYNTVLKCLEYNNPDIEVVVSDNCSEDNTQELLSKIKDERFKYFKNEYNNGANNLISVLTYGTGEYLLLTSDEDSIVKENMDTIIEVLEKEKPAVLMGSVTLFGKEYAKHRNGCYSAGFEAIRNYGSGRSYMSGYIYNKTIMEKVLNGMHGTDIDRSRFGYMYNFTNLAREMLQYGSLCFREEVVTNQIMIGKKDMGTRFEGGKILCSPEMRFVAIKEKLNTLARIDLEEEQKYLMCEYYLNKDVLAMHTGQYISTFNDELIEKYRKEEGSELLYDYYIKNRIALKERDIFKDIEKSIKEYIEYINEIGIFKQKYEDIAKKYEDITVEYKVKREAALNVFRKKKEIIDGRSHIK